MHRLLTATSSLRGKMGVEVLSYYCQHCLFYPANCYIGFLTGNVKQVLELLDYQHIYNILIESTQKLSLHHLYNTIYWLSH